MIIATIITWVSSYAYLQDFIVEKLNPCQQQLVTWQYLKEKNIYIVSYPTIRECRKTEKCIKRVPFDNGGIKR
jgi:hypothetical protein